MTISKITGEGPGGATAPPRERDPRLAVRLVFQIQVGGEMRRAMRGVRFELTLPGGSKRDGQVSARGTVIEASSPPGSARIKLKDLLDTPPACYPEPEDDELADPSCGPGERVHGPFDAARLASGIEGLETGVLHRIVVEREVIPVLFVPGIMGSRLMRRARGEDERVWDPDKEAWMFMKYGTSGPRSKQRRILGPDLDSADLEPFDGDPDHHAFIVKKLAKHARGDRPVLRREEVAARGWSGAAWGFYGDVLTRLQSCETFREWPEPLSSLYALPVYACGYNWTISNEHSGMRIRRRIASILQGERAAGARVEKIILVTHSMGGIASRAACLLEPGPGDGFDAPAPANDHVLGVVHGVQPVNGSPAAYRRMKAGFEGAWYMSWVLGANQREVTALLGNMPGGLELLPNEAYVPERGAPGAAWLEIGGPSGTRRWPEPGRSPYETIYLERHATHRMVTDRFLVPGVEEGGPLEIAWSRYAERVSEARDFHARLGLGQHAETHAFLGAGTQLPTASRVVFRLRPWRPSSGGEFGPEPPPPEGTERSGNGAYTAYVRENGALHEMILEPQAGAGDGTVPESSGAALRPSGRSHGSAPPAEAEAFTGVDHSKAYATGAGLRPSGDTIDFVIRAVERLVRLKAARR